VLTKKEVLPDRVRFTVEIFDDDLAQMPPYAAGKVRALLNAADDLEPGKMAYAATLAVEMVQRERVVPPPHTVKDAGGIKTGEDVMSGTVGRE